MPINGIYTIFTYLKVLFENEMCPIDSLICESTFARMLIASIAVLRKFTLCLKSGLACGVVCGKMTPTLTDVATMSRSEITKQVMMTSLEKISS